MPDSLITHQSINPAKVQLAKDLRSRMTPAERKLWAWLRNDRLEGYHFRRQQIIEPYIADFYCHQAALVIEVDGGIHQNQQEQDAQRDEFLRSRGLRVIHFSNSDVDQNIGVVLHEILTLCRNVPEGNGTNSAPPFREGQG